jgi:ketosteroid isomerase-like protein
VKRWHILATALVATTALAMPASAADTPAGDATALPLAVRRVPASSDECAVWRRERAFAQSVETHDARAFASFLHAGTVFNAGGAEADRGRETVAQNWAEIVEGKTLVLRWRPGIVHIGGDPAIALSRGPFILQTTRDGAPAFSVGLYQTVWVRDPGDANWRVLFDAGASTPTRVADRAAAESWVVSQPMSDCATP